MVDTRETYEAPKLTEIGSFEEITQGLHDGSFTDMNFPTDTPKPLLTFS